MTHPPAWTEDEPCPSCGSWEITKYEIRIGGASTIQMGWECRDCGHLATWAVQREGLTAAGSADAADHERR
jgi:uncharacterized Zn finger protein